MDAVKAIGSHGEESKQVSPSKGLGWHGRLTRTFVKRIPKYSMCLLKDFPVFAGDHKIFIYLAHYLSEKRHWFPIRTPQLQYQVT